MNQSGVCFRVKKNRLSRSSKRTAVLCGLASILSGCALPVVGGLTVAEIATAGSVATFATTGKGLSEFAMDVATGRDCRLLEGIARDNRLICEHRASPALEDDWKGLFDPDAEPVAIGPVADPGSERRDVRRDHRPAS